MIIVYCCDQNYLPVTFESIRSVKKYNPNAQIIIASMKPLQMYPIEGLGFKTVVIPVNHQFRFRGPSDRITPTAYLRHYLPDALPQYDKIIYLDGDTICQRPLNSLWDMPCPFINVVQSHKYGDIQAKDLGLKKYALSGMMVMNLKALREFHWLDKCLEVEKAPISNLLWRHDETMLNIAGKGRLVFIDKAYNYCKSRQYDDPINEYDAYILHVCGPRKDFMYKQTYYNSVPDLKRDIRGKQVAIVGNAKSLFDHSYGKEIDSHNFIIRFNKGFLTNPESQGTKTSLLMLATNLSQSQIFSYKTKWILNRSTYYKNPGAMVLPNEERERMFKRLGSQPSTGHMAIDLCLASGAGSIDLYGFDFEATPTFYNPANYQTKHDYDKEKEVISEYINCGLVRLHN